MTELADVGFEKRGEKPTRIVLKYNPKGRTVYHAGDECSSGFLDMVLGLKGDILKIPILESEVFHPKGLKMSLDRTYRTEEFQINEYFSALGIMGCNFDIKNLKSGNRLYAPFFGISPEKNYYYDCDKSCLCEGGKRNYLPEYLELGMTEAAARRVLSIPAQEIAKKVC